MCQWVQIPEIVREVHCILFVYKKYSIISLFVVKMIQCFVYLLYTFCILRGLFTLSKLCILKSILQGGWNQFHYF